MKHSVFEHDGKKYTINIDERGYFTAVVTADVTVTAQSLDDCRKKIVRATRKASVRIALPASYAQGRNRWGHDGDESTEIVDVTVTGVHQRTDAILIRYEGGKADSIDRYERLLRRLTPAEKAEYLRLAKASRDAQAAFKKFDESHQFGKREIEAAVQKAEKAAGVEDE